MEIQTDKWIMWEKCQTVDLPMNACALTQKLSRWDASTHKIHLSSLVILWFKSVHHWDIIIWATNVSMWDFAFPRGGSKGLRQIVKVNSRHSPHCYEHLKRTFTWALESEDVSGSWSSGRALSLIDLLSNLPLLCYSMQSEISVYRAHKHLFEPLCESHFV